MFSLSLWTDKVYSEVILNGKTKARRWRNMAGD